MVRYGMARYGMVRYDMARYGKKQKRRGLQRGSGEAVVVVPVTAALCNRPTVQQYASYRINQSVQRLLTSSTETGNTTRLGATERNTLVHRDNNNNITGQSVNAEEPVEELHSQHIGGKEMKRKMSLQQSAATRRPGDSGASGGGA
ncbi:hypothetical protein EYF80_041298 [Liparis tanakae]|uniref:Uncharacterized protein n=1 Tax=Liparis tanakae TaxID=230148 RepID=A0A4Z2G5U9_9TELE|nr:hypothetical protein EYF80_041298 [Liparis tanakae]